jgi:hypothetical protein
MTAKSELSTLVAQELELHLPLQSFKLAEATAGLHQRVAFIG